MGDESKLLAVMIAVIAIAAFVIVPSSSASQTGNVVCIACSVIGFIYAGLVWFKKV